MRPKFIATDAVMYALVNKESGRYTIKEKLSDAKFCKSRLLDPSSGYIQRVRVRITAAPARRKGKK